MGFFKRTRTLEERFPPERLGWLPTTILTGGMLHASQVGADDKALTSSRFFAGYLMGYPVALDGINEQLGAAIRMMIFRAIYGEAQSDHIYQRITGHMMLDDQQVRRGIGFGEPDGKRYFQALENGQTAEDATLSLKTAFEIGSVDLNQTV